MTREQRKQLRRANQKREADKRYRRKLRAQKEAAAPGAPRTPREQLTAAQAQAADAEEQRAFLARGCPTKAPQALKDAWFRAAEMGADARRKAITARNERILRLLPRGARLVPGPWPADGSDPELVAFLIDSDQKGSRTVAMQDLGPDPAESDEANPADEE